MSRRYIPRVESDGLRHYGQWAGNPKGSAEDVQLCIVEVSSGGRGPMYYQCSRKRGHGPDGLYCASHAPQKAALTVWSVRRYGNEIKSHSAVRLTDESVFWESGRREKRRSEYVSYFATEEEARNALINRLTVSISNHETALRLEREVLANLTAQAQKGGE